MRQATVVTGCRNFGTLQTALVAQLKCWRIGGHPGTSAQNCPASDSASASADVKPLVNVKGKETEFKIFIERKPYFPITRVLYGNSIQAYGSSGRVK